MRFILELPDGSKHAVHIPGVTITPVLPAPPDQPDDWWLTYDWDIQRQLNGVQGRHFLVDPYRGADHNEGTTASPWATLERAGQAQLQPGDAVFILGGQTYYEPLLVHSSGEAQKPVQFIGLHVPGQYDHKPVVSGVDHSIHLDWWRRADDLGGETDIIECEVDKRLYWHPSGGRKSQRVFWRPDMLVHHRGGQDTLLTFNKDVLNLSAGEFSVDGEDYSGAGSRKLVARLEPGMIEPEIKMVGRQVLCKAVGGAAHVVVRGLGFQHCANGKINGSIDPGDFWTLHKTITTGCLGSGVHVQTDGVQIIGHHSTMNGNMGISADGAINLALSECFTGGNNTRGFDPDWHAGGGKYSNTRGLTIAKHRSADDDGPGVWLDINNDGSRLLAIQVLSAQRAGLQLEANTRNCIVHNLEAAFTRVNEQGKVGAGLIVQAAADITMERATLVFNDGPGIIWKVDTDNRMMGHGFNGSGIVSHGNGTKYGGVDMLFEAQEESNVQRMRLVRSFIDLRVKLGAFGDGEPRMDPHQLFDELDVQMLEADRDVVHFDQETQRHVIDERSQLAGLEVGAF